MVRFPYIPENFVWVYNTVFQILYPYKQTYIWIYIPTTFGKVKFWLVVCMFDAKKCVSNRTKRPRKILWFSFTEGNEQKCSHTIDYMYNMLLRIMLNLGYILFNFMLISCYFVVRNILQLQSLWPTSNSRCF